MIAWLDLSIERQQQILKIASERTRLPEYAIEKDWWVTLALRAVFATPLANRMVFKGGTSLSKAWNLIERFSEDIDLALDRAALDFGGELSKEKVKKLKKEASSFISNPFRDHIERALLDIGVPSERFQLKVRPSDQSDLDPRVLELHYSSAVNPDPYIENRVLIEIGARSLMEPSSLRNIRTILADLFPDQPFSGSPFAIQTVDPTRTFLEKAFLLHECFAAKSIKTLPNRQTRHLYDLEKLMDTSFAQAALLNENLYESIVKHREKFNPIRGISYKLHAPATIDFIPPFEVLSEWRADYSAMQQMIHGPSLPFDQLLARLKELRWRFRAIKPLRLPPGVTINDVVARAKDQIIKEGLLARSWEGGNIRMPVQYNLYLNRPAGPNNVDRRYLVTFRVVSNDLVLDDCIPIPDHQT